MLRTISFIVLIFLVSVLFPAPTLAANDEAPEPEPLKSEGRAVKEESGRSPGAKVPTETLPDAVPEAVESGASGSEELGVDFSGETETAYVDLDRDGVNDQFCDPNGDGLNDVTGKPYPHRFEFEDADGDGVNDTFTDRDGDGVNDLDARNVDEDEDGICDNVIDYDGDGVNDVTGLRYSREPLKGFQDGHVGEEAGVIHSAFRDEDGDGLHDAGAHHARDGLSVDGMDVFIDEDGDGICDGRTFMGRPMMGGRGTVPSDMGRGRGHPGAGDGSEMDNGKHHTRGKK